MSTFLTGDPRRANKIHRFTPSASDGSGEPIVDYMNFLGMILSICGMMFESKWCAWAAVFCGVGTFANSRVSEDMKQLISIFLLAISVLIMCYIHNPTPLSLQI
ncbi:unnamed protein product [Schistocephalus solidus]|uniref:Protein Asterix n=1 Tax=Schistocephalus solidus TaxID=70667 RepID=A0A0X3NWQ4_SCHSO|nr:unnamed protein product [Schistocephalus solidus]